MNDPKLALKIWTPCALAELVKRLRDAQKASGTGYKAAGAATATALEKQVDAAIQTILSRSIF